MLGICLDNVRKVSQLIHNITNYVTVNDVANTMLACGENSIMPDDPADAENITALCSALSLNIGTLSSRTIDSMFRAGRKAQDLEHTLLLDPAGADADKADSVSDENLAFMLKFVTAQDLRGIAEEICA